MQGDLTTLDSVKAWIPVTNTNDDALLTSLVTRVSTFVQSWLNRTIAQQGYSEVRNGQDMQLMLLANYPVTAVSSVVVDGIVIPARGPLGPGTFATPGGYTFDASALYLSGCYRFTRGFQNVAVSYVAGFATTPPDLEQATNMIIASWYRTQRGAASGVQTQSIENQSITFIREAIPDAALLILQQYKQVAPIQ